MSDVKATLERARDVHPLPNSDNLDLITVGGFPVLTRRGTIKENDLVVYFPPDLEIPPFVSHSLGVIDYLKKLKVVKTVKLLGQVSYGVALPLDTPGFDRLTRYLEASFWCADQSGEGADLDFYFGTKRFIPVLNEAIKKSMGKEVLSHPLLQKYTDIERFERHQHAFNADEEVVITEKIHGTNSRIACINGEIIVGSHNTQRAPLTEGEDAKNNFYWFPLTISRVAEMIRELGETHAQVILYGEVYGKGVQGGFDYGTDGLAYAAYDLMLNGTYVDYPRFINIAQNYGIPIVPVDYSGPYDPSYIELFRDAQSWLTRTHIREGIVIKPRNERQQGRLGRCILKALNPEYLVKKSAGKVEDNPIV
jgi:RNA ligase (TIGR02306 family)